MKNRYIGYLSSPVGLKGEIKVLSSENHLDKIFKIGNIVYLDNKEYTIASFRVFKNNPIISFKEYEDINLINDLLKKDIYINRDNIVLDSNEYLYSDLENINVFVNKNIGKVEEILLSKNNPIIRVGELLIPLNEHFISNIDLRKKILYLKNVEELYED